MKIFLSVLICFIILGVSGAEAKKKKAQRKSPFTTIEYTSKYDNTKQKALVWFAKSKEKRPLAVVLHTWSFDYKGGESYAMPVIKNDYHMISPDFRGRNNAGNFHSMGSDAAVEDIVCAVEYMKQHANVDEERIYLVGGSGGGHMGLLMAGRHPEIWAAVSVWCPISDLTKWCEFHNGKSYGKHIVANLKGDPLTNADAAKESAKRSPINWLANAKNVNLDIGTGIHDGHSGSVPIDQAINAYNLIAADSDKVPQEHIRHMLKTETAPEGTPKFTDVGYGSRKIHYRKISGNCRITVFEGGHNILSNYSYLWFKNQKKGKPAVWSTEKDSGKTLELTK